MFVMDNAYPVIELHTFKSMSFICNITHFFNTSKNKLLNQSKSKKIRNGWFLPTK